MKAASGSPPGGAGAGRAGAATGRAGAVTGSPPPPGPPGPPGIGRPPGHQGGGKNRSP